MKNKIKCEPIYMQRTVIKMAVDKKEKQIVHDTRNFFSYVDNNECNSKPCVNGGTCYQGYPGDYMCSCVGGWSGKNCYEGKTWLT